MRQTKTLGQVYTPENIVNDILDAANYSGSRILKKHVMENSFGEGAFLTKIVKRYIEEFQKTGGSAEQLVKDLEEYIHGIDIDPPNLVFTTNALNDLAHNYGLDGIRWDLSCADSMTVTKYDNSMDYVLGNPPYVRVHNLNDSYDAVKRFSFAQDGMTDIYIVFFEIGINMLKQGGILSYITANSYYSSLAGTSLREYIRKTGSLYKIMDLGHYNPFFETTYTTITCIEKGKIFDDVEYYAYDTLTGRPIYKDSIPYSELFVSDNIVLLAGSQARKDFEKIYSINRKVHPEIAVKNGFATLCDSAFIGDDIPDSNQTIKVIKASTGKWTKCIYPYDKNGKLIPFESLDEVVQEHFLWCEEALRKRNLVQTQDWYAYGRSQAISDVKYERIAINQLIKDVNSVKMEKVAPGEGVYSGLYIISNKYSFEEIESVIKSEDFVDYVRAVFKCKSGGYFTFSTDDLGKYLIFKLSGPSAKQTSLFNYP